MKKETAVIYATIVTNYLAVNHGHGYITLDISQYEVRVHFFDLSKTDQEIIEIGEKAAHNLGGDCKSEFRDNDQIPCKTFDIIWQIDPME